MAAVVESEAGLISARTRAALQAAKARSTRPGGAHSVKLTDEARAMGREAAPAAKAGARATTIVSAYYRPLGSLPRKAGWSAATSCSDPKETHLAWPTDQGFGQQSGASWQWAPTMDTFAADQRQRGVLELDHAAARQRDVAGDRRRAATT
jgi:hypothetical protein